MKKIIFIVLVMIISQNCQKGQTIACQPEPDHGIFLLLYSIKIGFVGRTFLFATETNKNVRFYVKTILV